jgi:chromosome partitioning protein
MKRLAILNQKGGVGKTTTAVNLAYGLAIAGRRTLLVDLDPQAHATVIFHPEPPVAAASIGQILERKDTELASLIRPAVVRGKVLPNLWVVPSSIGLAATAERMIAQHYRERRLDRTLARVGDAYDVVLIDCPPNLGVLAVNTLYTADKVIVPVSYGRYALDGLADLLATIREVREDADGLVLVLRNAFDARTTSTNAYVEEQLDAVRRHVMRTIVRKSEAVNQAAIAGEPAAVFDARGNGATDYAALVAEVLLHV